jgi:multidrug transporter EmrE-like cation transporter
MEFYYLEILATYLLSRVALLKMNTGNHEMTISILLLIIISVWLSALAQISLKMGMSGGGVVNALNEGGILQIATSIIQSGWILTGFFLYVVGAILWLFVLARVEVSYAYPFVGIGFIFTMVLGKIFLGDQITVIRITGALVVIIGLAMVARS